MHTPGILVKDNNSSVLEETCIPMALLCQTERKKISVIITAKMFDDGVLEKCVIMTNVATVSYMGVYFQLLCLSSPWLHP